MAFNCGTIPSRSGPLVASLTSRLGHRLVTILGVTIASLGLLTAAVYIHLIPEPNILVLYVSVGIITGLGFGLMYLPAWDIIEVYFDKKLGFATGLAAAGAGIGHCGKYFSVFTVIFNFRSTNLLSCISLR